MGDPILRVPPVLRATRPGRDARTTASAPRERRHGAAVRLVVAIVAVSACCGPAMPARAALSDLAAFLERTDRMASYPTAVAADITIVRPDGKSDQAQLVIDPDAGKQFLALRSNGWRALLPLGWAKGTAVQKPGDKRVPWSVEDPLPGTDLRPMEFFVFWHSDYETAFVSDDSRLDKTITLYTDKTTPYILLVMTFDKSKLVPVDVKYYRGSMNSLVRLRRNRDYTMVGSRPRPQTIEIQDFVEASQTRCKLSWRVLTKVPSGLMDEDSFDKVELDWPEPAR